MAKVKKKTKNATKKKTTSRRRTSKKKGTKNNAMLEVHEPTGVGFDYGIRPRVLSSFNPDFLEYWNKAKSIAMAYTIRPQLGVRIDLPLE